MSPEDLLAPFYSLGYRLTNCTDFGPGNCVGGQWMVSFTKPADDDTFAWQVFNGFGDTFALACAAALAKGPFYSGLNPQEPTEAMRAAAPSLTDLLGLNKPAPGVGRITRRI